MRVQIDFTDMAKAWGCPWVARRELKRFSGGILDPRYAANLDAKGLGIEGRVRVGRQNLYPAEAACRFLQSRATEVESKA